MKGLELRRHALRQKDVDALSPEGRVQAESVGRSLRTDYVFVFISPATRAAETVAWFLRATGQALPPHATVPGLVSEREDDWWRAARAAGTARIDALREVDPGLVASESDRLAHVVLDEMFERIPEGGRALAVGHTPLIEAAAYGLTGVVLAPLGECEGIDLTIDDAGALRLDELRLPDDS